MQSNFRRFLEINPKGQVPAIKDGDFCLGGSTEICKYLIENRGIETPLYPASDPDKRKAIDDLFEEFKDLEPTTMTINMELWAGPLLRGAEKASDEKANQLKDDLYDVYTKIEDHLDRVGTKYLTSDGT